MIFHKRASLENNRLGPFVAILGLLFVGVIVLRVVLVFEGAVFHA